MDLDKYKELLLKYCPRLLEEGDKELYDQYCAALEEMENREASITYEELMLCNLLALIVQDYEDKLID